jgi:hypothetical protein
MAWNTTHGYSSLSLVLYGGNIRCQARVKIIHNICNLCVLMYSRCSFGADDDDENDEDDDSLALLLLAGK